MKLVRENVTFTSWREAINKLDERTRSNRVRFCRSTAPEWPEDGALRQVPLTNKEWAQLVGYEHDERCLWFRQTIRRNADGVLVAMAFGPSSLMALVRSITWNAAVYLSIYRRGIAGGAIAATAKMALRYSSCPEELRGAAVASIESACLSVLGAIWTSIHGVNRCGLELLREELDGYLNRRTCTNRALRRRICLQLLAEGIMNLGSRTEQDEAIREKLNQYPELKATARRAIIKALTSGREFLEATEGVVILKPHTKAELAALVGLAKTNANADTKAARVEAIKAKMRRGESLTGAERKFKCKFSALF